MEAAPRMSLYTELADWFHLLTSPDEYAGEARFVLATLRRHVDGPLETLLELGSGGGNTASHLKASLRLTLTDISPRMIDLSRTINPECEHVVGDMRSLRLGATFDAVLIHDAVGYMTTSADLRAAMDTARAHLRPGGAAILLPDFVRETFAPSTETGGHDSDGRALRFLDWTYDPDPADTTFVSEFAVLLREGRDDVRACHDRHVLGLLAEAEWLESLAAAGLTASVVGDDPDGRRVFVGVRPG